MRVEADEAQGIAHALADLAAGQLAFQAERDIAADRPPLQQGMRIVLKHDDDVRRRAVDRAAVDLDGPARARRQSAEQAQQRRLAGARRADDGQELAAAKLERDVLEDAPRAVLVRQLDAGAAAGEDQITRRSRRIGSTCRIHCAVTTILALSIGADNCPRSFSTSIQTPSSSGLMVKR